jgi:class 3 adenylate cyclase
MEPQFRFCTGADGRRIAYATYGKGPPLLSMVINVGVDGALTIPESRAFYDALAERVTLGIYDQPGTGASGRRVADYSLRAQEADIAAVADALEWEEFCLFVDNLPIVPCGQYALAQPKRATRLIWWNTFYAGMVGTGAHLELPRAARAGGVEWSNLRRRMVSWYFPDGPVRLQREYGLAWKTASSRDASERSQDWVKSELADELLPTITTPALVLARSALTAHRPSVTRLAGLLPNSELRFVVGNSGEPFPDHEPVVDAIVQFLGVGAHPAAMASLTAVILFTDIVSSTELTERMGDSAFREASRSLDAGLRAAIRDAGGAAVEGKLLGDGVLATFPSAAQAIDGARRCLALSAASELGLHIGLHAGDVIREDGNVFGGAVNIAARICGLSAPGEILVSDVVRGMARSSAGVTFDDRGEQEMKGVGEPVRVYAVRSESLG